jgi:phosphatidate cytidylyltransferase
VSNLAQRTLTGLVAATVAIGSVWAGEWVFGIFVAAIALAAQAEVYNLLAKAGTRPFVVLGLGLGALATLRPLLPVSPRLLVLGGLAVLVGALYTRKETPLLDAAGTLFGVAYPAALAGSIVALRVAEPPWLDGLDAFWLTTAVLFCIWGADTFAYFAGRAFGRRPLFERVSPKKTWEGAVGGALGALVVAAGFKLAALGDVLTWVDVVAVALCCGVASQFGDLVESHFKRSVGVKDSASWLPGHGGLLDRIDAAVVAAPLVVLYFDWVKGIG